MKKSFIITVLVVIIPVFVSGGDNGEKYPLINKLSWIAGSYQGEKWGGIIEEYWTLPSGNNMMGMFRFIKNDEIVFTEIMYITEEDNTLSMKLKHFSKGLTGWEEKDKYVSFPLVEIRENEIRFDGLAFKKPSEDKLEITVMIEDDSTGAIKPEIFEYRKAAI
jgi:hypothetical protein